jgi:hypothetical protein
MARRPKPIHHAAGYGLDVASGDNDMFRWFLLAYLFGKPIQSSVAAQTWQLFIDRRIDTPWAILAMPPRQLVRLLDEGKYTRYDEVTTRALRTCTVSGRRLPRYSCVKPKNCSHGGRNRQINALGVRPLKHVRRRNNYKGE